MTLIHIYVAWPVGSALQIQQLERLLAHLHLADLARDGHGQLLHHVHMARDLVVGDLPLRELRDGFRRDGGPRPDAPGSTP